MKKVKCYDGRVYVDVSIEMTETQIENLKEQYESVPVDERSYRTFDEFLESELDFEIRDKIISEIRQGNYGDILYELTEEYPVE